MRVVVIGGTGHIGSYLVPRLVRAGHEVVSISRGQSPPYRADDSWAAVEQVVLDKDAEEQRGTFGDFVAGLRPDAAVDLLCYTMDSATQLAAALRGSPAGICGALARGDEVALPHLGLETLHHVHADDVAQAFMLALDQPSQAIGQAFHVVSEQALTMRGFAAAVASWFGQEARLRYEPWETWSQQHDPEDVEHTWNHLRHSPCISMAKAARMLGYAPRYRSLDALREAVAWLADDGQIDTGGHPMRRAPAGAGAGQV